MGQFELRELLNQWFVVMDRRARRAFVPPEVVQNDFSNVWVGISCDGLRIGNRDGGGGLGVLLDPANAAVAEKVRVFVVETIKEREAYAVQRRLLLGDYTGFATELKRDLAEDAIVGDL